MLTSLPAVPVTLKQALPNLRLSGMATPPEPPRIAREKSFDPQSVKRALALSPKPRPPATIRDDGAFDPGEDDEPTGAIR